MTESMTPGTDSSGDRRRERDRYLLATAKVLFGGVALCLVAFALIVAAVVSGALVLLTAAEWLARAAAAAVAVSTVVLAVRERRRWRRSHDDTGPGDGQDPDGHAEPGLSDRSHSGN